MWSPCSGGVDIPEDINGLRRRLESRITGCNQMTLALWAMGLGEHIAMEFGDSDALADATALCNEAVEGFIAGTMDRGEIRRRIVGIKSLIDGTDDPVEQSVLRVITQAASVCTSSDHAANASEYAIRAIGFLHPEDEREVEREVLWQLDYFDHV